MTSPGSREMEIETRSLPPCLVLVSPDRTSRSLSAEMISPNLLGAHCNIFYACLIVIFILIFLF